MPFLGLGCRRDAPYPPPAVPGQPIPDTIPPVLTPGEAALFVGHPEVVFVDARPKKAYGQGHPAGAVNIEWTAFREGGPKLASGKLDSDLDGLAGIFGGLGVGRDSWVVVFGDPLAGWGEEARIAWTLNYLGAERVSVVDGGVPAWIAQGHPIQRGVVRRPARLFQPLVHDEILARRVDVERFVATRDSWRTVLLDVREPEEYRGTDESPTYGAVRRGHIPGAVNVPFRSLLDAQGRIRPPEELGAILLARGVRPDAHIIVYCTGGVRSAHTWFVLTALGFPSVKNYAGSWWEWSLDRRLRVELGGMRERPPAPPWPPPADSGDDDSAAPSGDDDSAGPAGDDDSAGPSGDDDSAAPPGDDKVATPPTTAAK